jgi:surface protein
VTIRTQTGFTYDYDVSVSTGESFTNQTGDLVMTFGDNVPRTFTVSGLFPGFKCENDASARFQVQQWGSQPWRSLYAAFWHPTFTLTSVGSDVPNLFLCDSLYQTFRGVVNFPASNNLSQWKTSQVTSFRGCFRDGTGGLNNIDITNWDTGKATVMMEMFSNNLSDWSLTSTDVSQWNTRNVTIFQQMFFNNYTFNQPIQNWDVSGASGNAFLSFLYNSTTNLGQFNQPLGSWNINPANYGANFFRAMFYGQNAFDQDLSAWTITGLPNVQGNFNDFITNADLVARPMSFSRANYDKLLISWANQGFVYPEIISFGNAQYTLGGAAEAARNTLVNTYGWTITDGGGVNTNFEFTINTALNGGNGSGNTSFQLPLISTSTVNATVDWGDGTVNTVTAYNDPNALHTYASTGTYNISINGTLNGWSCLQAPVHSNDSRKITNISNWGIYDVTESGAFANAINMNGTATDYPATSGGTLESMFQNCSLWNCPMDHWDVSGVTNMANLFFSANAFNQPLNSWDVSNVTNMGNMFRTTTTNAFNQPLNNWDVSNVTEMIQMFAFANSFNGDITSWQLTSNPRIQAMFQGASAFNQPIVNWDIDGISSAAFLFKSASSFDQNLGNWIIRTIFSFDWFDSSSGLSTANYDSTLIGWSGQANIPAGKTANFGTSQYTLGGAAEAARTSLINTNGWTIIDGGGV